MGEMKKLDKEFIRQKLLTDPRWLYRGILAIHARQTEEEKQIGTTRELNGVGFNGVDAEVLTSFAEQLLNQKKEKRAQFLTPKQLKLAQKKMQKYAGQLLRIAKSGEQLGLLGKEA